jgi:hypothetical protein
VADVASAKRHRASGPTVSVEIYAPSFIELHSFGFQHYTLDVLESAPAGPCADLAFSVDHAVPWYVRPVGNRRHGVTDLPGSAWQVRLCRDGAVGCHPAVRDSPYDGVVSFVGSHGGRSLATPAFHRNAYSEEK